MAPLQLRTHRLQR